MTKNWLHITIDYDIWDKLHPHGRDSAQASHTHAIEAKNITSRRSWMPIKHEEF
jgi:hypothetical protein